MVRIAREQYTYRFAADVARVRPGDTVIFETYDASTGRIRTPEDVHHYMRIRDITQVNPAAGPVAVALERTSDKRLGARGWCKGRRGRRPGASRRTSVSG